jgi:pyruvate-formate lyase-activating enzyme
MTKKILCIGNNTQDTDVKTREIAQAEKQVCHGLLSELHKPLDPNDYSQNGYYHSSVYDIEVGTLMELCEKFDQVILLDQPKSQWTHPDAFYQTIKLLNGVGVPVTFLNPDYRQSIDYFENLVQKNKSFCIFPFIELLVNFDHTTVCCRSNTPITHINKLKNFATDQNYNQIRNKMISGELVPEHCSSCYRLEDKGIISARMQETVEWANRLDLNTIHDLKKIVEPVYYEVRADNKCNLQCRTCSPDNSHLIEKEYKKLGLSVNNNTKKHSTGFDIVRFDQLKKLYIAGGEPTLLADFYQFIDTCIREQHTDFELLVNTNGTKLSNRFKNQLKNFSNFQFIFSIDGVDQLNHYIRWPASWSNIVDNWHYLRQQGHKVIVNTTVSIYNIAFLDQIFKFVDSEFPGTLVHCQIVDSPDMLSPFLYPYPESVLESLYRVSELNCFKNDHLFASSINGYIKYFESCPLPNIPMLTKFFEFNDKLDQSRQVQLENYLPELDNYRNFIV